jgi:hypothetical protein
MPAKPIDSYWENRIYEIAANNEKTGPYRIENTLADEASENPSLPPPPVANTIKRYLDGFRKKRPDEQGPYRYLSWPNSMKLCLLPWVASAACLELLALADVYQMPRPPVSLARWYWRVSQVMPDITIPQVRVAIAVTLASHDETGRPLPDGMEWWLAYAPYRQGNLPGYERAVARSNDPVTRYTPGMQAALGGPSGTWGARLIMKGIQIGFDSPQEEESNGDTQG